MKNIFILLNLIALIISVESISKNNRNKQIVYVNYLLNKSNRSKSIELIFSNEKKNNTNTRKIIDLNLNSGLINQNAVIHYSSSSLESSLWLDELAKIDSKHKDCLFYGQLRDEPESLVALATCEQLTGFIQWNGETYFIEPVKEHRAKRSINQGEAHLFWPKPNRISNERNSNRKLRSREKRSNFEYKERTIETLLVADHLVYEHFKTLNESLEDYLIAVFNMVSVIYRDPSIGNPIKFSLVKILILQNETSELQIDTDPLVTLASFSKFQHSINYPEQHPFHHDLAVLVTEKDFCYKNSCDVQGFSNQGSICRPELSANVNENDGLALAFTIAHEIGHNLNANHDSDECLEGNQNVIMKSFNDHSLSYKTWSECSRDAIHEFLNENGACLENKPLMHILNESEVSLPGLIYNLDKQCQLSNGPNYTSCSESETNSTDNLCKSLWCRRNDEIECRVNSAVAEGTICNEDGNHWCFKGKCVRMGDSSETVIIDGNWSDWSEWSNCTHLCGGGVQFRERKCNNPSPSYYGKYCSGESKVYQLCNIQTCSPREDLFERQNKQCLKNSKQHDLNPKAASELIFYYDSSSPCKLLCTVNGNIYEIASKVEDGTKCRPESNDVCINGECRHVGCDFVLNSNAVNDLCGVCDGNNTSCSVFEDVIVFNKAKKKINGYNYLLTLPKNAINIQIKNDNAKNFMAIKDSLGKFFLNGDYRIQSSRIINIDKIKLNYSRSDLEIISIDGPLKYPLHLMFLYLDKISNINYKYAVDNSSITPEPFWITEEWSNTCTVNPCKNETRVVKCSSSIEGSETQGLECNMNEKPPSQRRCSMAENVICKKRVVEILEQVMRTFKDNFLSLLAKIKN